MFARTKRLTLRPGWPEDAPALAAAIAHEGVATRLAHVPWPYSLADAESFLAHAAVAGDLHLLILAHEDGRPRIAGATALTRSGDAHSLGYWLTPSAWGRGYATEAGEAMLDIARHALGIRRLVAHAHADNPASQQVLRKLGFRATGRALRPSRARGGLVPSVSFARELDEEPRRQPLAA